MSATQLWDELLREVRQIVADALSDYRPNLTRATGVVPGNRLPSGGNTGSGYSPTAHAATHEAGGDDALDLGSLAGELTDAQHGSRGGGSLHDAATTSTAGFVQLAPSGGTTAGTVVQATDARLSDARTPLAHHASHQHGGSDEVATATPAANAIPKAGSGSTIADGWLSAAIARLTDLPTTLPPSGAAGGVLSGSYPNPGFAADMATQVELDAHTALTTTAHGGIVANSDSRLSDARTPTAHHTTHQHGGSDEIAVVTPAAHGIPKAGSDAHIDDSWLSSAIQRTEDLTWDNILDKPATFSPSAHASSHKHGGSDEVATATPSANAIPKAGSGGTLADGWLSSAISRAADLTTHAALTTTAHGGIVASSDSRLTDARTPTAHHTTHQHGGADEVATATPGANAIPKAGAGGTLADGWLSSAISRITSVALAAPAQFSVSGSPLTANGTLTLAWQNQSANVVLAGPSSGSAAAPAFRALVAGDIPNLDAAKLTTGQLPVARGGTGVGAIPAFHVHKNGTNQTGIVSATFTLLTWSTEVVDSNNNFASNRFTPSVAGTYLIALVVAWVSMVDQSYMVPVIYKNGALYAQGAGRASGASDQSSNVIAVVAMNGTTDYIEAYGYQGTGSNKDIYGGSASTYFSGAWIGP